MPVTALDVGLVGATAGVVAPLTAYLTARGTWKHERQIRRGERDYEARRDVYYNVANDARLRIEVLTLLKNHELPDVPSPPGADAHRALVAQLVCVGPHDVLLASDLFDKAFYAAFDARTSTGDGARSKFDELYDDAGRKLLELEALLRTHLSE